LVATLLATVGLVLPSAASVRLWPERVPDARQDRLIADEAVDHAGDGDRRLFDGVGMAGGADMRKPGTSAKIARRAAAAINLAPSDPSFVGRRLKAHVNRGSVAEGALADLS